MTLQKLLLKLSRLKDYSTECSVYNDKMTITIKEWYNFDVVLEVEINLNEKLDVTPFKNLL